jgi:Tol biopolymer transport system component
MLRAAVTLGLVAAALSAPVAAAATGDVERVSVATSGAQGDDDSTAPSISADGSVVAFQSRASTLTGGDTNGGLDVFVRRRASRETQRVSGGPGVSAGSSAPALSADGGSAAFESFAPELGGGAFSDIFLRHSGGPIFRLTAPTGNGDDVGGSAPSISADGARVAFQSSNQQLIAGDDNGLSDVFLWRGNSIRRLSEDLGGAEANGFSDQPAIAGGGGFVAYRSEATNLVAGSDAVATADVFVTALSGVTQRVSLALGGAQPNGDSEDPALSGNGELVAFRSAASNLVPGDGNGRDDIFVYDRNRGATERVSVASDGAEGTAHAVQPSISSDGRFVAFASLDTALTPGDINNVVDIFVHDRQTDVTTRVSRRPGSPFSAGDESFAPSISAHGCFVAFETDGGGTFVPDDTNGASDVYVVELGSPGCAGAGAGGPAGGGSGPVDPIGPQPPATDPVGQPRERDPVAAAPVRGTVRVRARGSRRFVRLRRAGAIPNGSEIDTRRGVLRLVVATRRGTASALVSRGRAIVDRTTLTLSGPRACPSGRRLLMRAGDARFRTRTKRTAATGRRSAWLTRDRCNGTVTEVARRKVAVKDLARRRTVLVRARDSYRARG